MRRFALAMLGLESLLRCFETPAAAKFKRLDFTTIGRSGIEEVYGRAELDQIGRIGGVL